MNHTFNTNRFIQKHSLEGFLVEATNRLSLFFGEEATYRIELFAPLDDDPMLILSIISTHDWKRGLTLLDDFSDDWWLDQIEFLTLVSIDHISDEATLNDCRSRTPQI